MQTTCFISLNLHSNRYNVNRATAYLAKQASLFRVFPHYSILEYSSYSSVKPRLKFSMRQQLMLTSVSYSGMSSRLTHMASESSSFCRGCHHQIYPEKPAMASRQMNTKLNLYFPRLLGDGRYERLHYEYAVPFADEAQCSLKCQYFEVAKKK